MIELDDERLSEMQDGSIFPREEDLQAFDLERMDQETVQLKGQRAYWNAEHGGATIEGPAVYNEEDEYGVHGRRDAHPSGHIAVVKRGGATFSMKAHLAAQAGADALIVLNHETRFPPAPRIGAGSLKEELRVAWKARSCGFPPIP